MRTKNSWSRQRYWDLIKEHGPMTIGSVFVISGRPRGTIKKMLYKMSTDNYLSRSERYPGGTRTVVYGAIGDRPKPYLRSPESLRRSQMHTAKTRLTGPINAALDRWCGIRQC